MKNANGKRHHKLGNAERLCMLRNANCTSLYDGMSFGYSKMSYYKRLYVNTKASPTTLVTTRCNMNVLVNTVRFIPH